LTKKEKWNWSTELKRILLNLTSNQKMLDLLIAWISVR